MKRGLWTRFGYTKEMIDSMASQRYWDEEYARIEEIDPAIAELRGPLV